MPKLSGKELAGKLGCAPSTLSEAANEGYLVGSRWDVGQWAVWGPSGRLRHYDVPGNVAFLNGEQRSNPESDDPDELPSLLRSSGLQPVDEDSQNGNSEDGVILQDIILQQQETVREVAEKSGNRTHLVPEGTDVAGATKNAGFAYTAGKAIQHEGPGAHTFWTVGSALAGGAGGYAITEDGFGALIGAILFGSAGYLAYAESQRSSTPRREMRSWRSDQDWQQPR